MMELLFGMIGVSEADVSVKSSTPAEMLGRGPRLAA
jgi:hypothetical protein